MPTPKVQKMLFGRSACICNKCKVPLSYSNAQNETLHKGEMAHIEGEKETAARYNPNMTEEQRAEFPNLILLCPSCHKEIDDDPVTYTIVLLKKMKKDHEDYVVKKLISALPNVTFSELDNILKFLLSSYDPQQSDLTLVPPKDKIAKNELSGDVTQRITFGMSKVSLVKDYLNKHPDIDFANRLKKGFVEKYLELKNLDYNGDEIFYTLSDFASANSADFLKQAAGLSVLVYFFEQCDIFEK